MNILLNGYFDKNFGDDAMQEMIVAHFSEYDFFPNCKQREMLAHLEKYENVHIGENIPNVDLFLNVIGTGFLYQTRFAKVTKLNNDQITEVFQIAQVFNVEVVDMNNDSVILESKLTEHRNNDLIALLKSKFKNISVVRGGAVAIESISTGCR